MPTWSKTIPQHRIRLLKEQKSLLKSVSTCSYSLILYNFSMGCFVCLTKEEPTRFFLFSTQECWKLKLSRFVFLQWIFTRWCKTEYSSPETHTWMNHCCGSRPRNFISCSWIKLQNENLNLHQRLLPLFPCSSFPFGEYLHSGMKVTFLMQ